MILFSQRLKELRKEKRLKQHEVAKFLNMSLTGYNQYETNGHEPSIQTIIKLAELFNVSIDYLLGYSDNRNYKELLDLLKNLSAADKHYVVDLIERLGKHNEKKSI